MNTVNNLIAWLDEHRDWTFEIVRIYLGIGLVVKGIGFAANSATLDTIIDQTGLMNFWMPVIAHYVVMVHIVGGAFIAIGLFTRLAALAQMPILVGAVFFVHLKSGLFAANENLEFSVLVFVLLGLCAAHGAGRWSVDSYLEHSPKAASAH